MVVDVPHATRNDVRAEMESHDAEFREGETVKPDWRGKAKVILFKPSGKYYTEEEWKIPNPLILEAAQQHLPKERRVGIYNPKCMEHSPDFRRIDGGAVLVSSEGPWGFPHLLNTERPEVDD